MGVSGSYIRRYPQGRYPQMSLTDTAIKAAKPAAKPYKLFDERGLYLLVKPRGGRLWRLKYRVDGREKSFRSAFIPTCRLPRRGNGATKRADCLPSKSILVLAKKRSAWPRQTHLNPSRASGWHFKSGGSPRRPSYESSVGSKTSVSLSWAAPHRKNHSARPLGRAEAHRSPWL